MNSKMTEYVTKLVGSVAGLAKVGLNPLSWLPLGKVIVKVVRAVERGSVCADDLPTLGGEEKEQAVVEWVNDKVDIPLLSEKLEAEMIKLIIHLIVSAFNEVIGKEWIKLEGCEGPVDV